MMHICNYNVTNENGALFFDENFCMAEFSMHFDLDVEDWDSSFGHLDFKPERHVATLFYYGHPEDLTPMITDYDLHDFDSECGDGVINALTTYNLSALYHAAEKFTYKVLMNLVSEGERLEQERLEHLEDAMHEYLSGERA